MKVLTVGIIISICVCSYNNAVGAGIGEPCTADGNCTEIGQACTGNGTCACFTDNDYIYDGSKCVKELGSVCTDSSYCNNEAVICDALCKCDTTTYYDTNGDSSPGGVCSARHAFGAACTNPASGAGDDQCSTVNAICKVDTGSDPTTYSCQCEDGFVPQVSSCVTAVNQCESNQCMNGGTCSGNTNTYSCTCTAGYSGTNCGTDKDECTLGTDNCDVNADCRNTPGSFQCTCRAGYSGNGASCIDKDECTLGTDNCDVNADCRNTPGSFQCTCRAGYSGNGASCIDKDECSLGSDNCDANADCSNTPGSFQCTCRAGYSGNGVSCIDINECESSPCLNGGTCSNLVDAYRCSCATDYTGQKCQVASLGASCSIFGTICNDQNAQCQSNGLGDGKTCQCMSSYYDDDGKSTIGGTCKSKVGLGSKCPMPDACMSSRAECIGSGNGAVCKCRDSYYDTNTENSLAGSCQDRRSLGASCASGHSNSYQCKDPNARCRTEEFSCLCNDRYHQDSGSCVPNVPLGGACKGDVVSECSDQNAGCINSKCTCSVGFYRYYPGSAQSICKNVDELQVTGITFQNVKTTQFTVGWTAPSKSSYVSGYRVDWKPKDNSVSVSSKDDASSPLLVTGLTPGKTYEVKVISKDTATEPGATRTTSTAKDQAAKPSVPGAVKNGTSELDASDGQITVEWTKGNGVTTRYSIKLLDGQTEITSTISSSISASFSPSNLLNGHNYNVDIKARSEDYNGNYLWSESRISAIKTKVQVPGPPKDGLCRSPTDSSITLRWTTPEKPNGDLVQYYIHVYQHPSSFKFIVSTAGTGTENIVRGLEPGTNYEFRIYTENEKYNSSNFETVASNCKTKAQMSEAPRNLQITGVTSRGFNISWDKPGEIYSEENYGYVLQIKDDQDKCEEEIIYRCSNCRGDFQLSDLVDLCDSTVRTQISTPKLKLEGQLTYLANLNPDINYTVTVTAINDAGRGYPASKTKKTLEEAPQKPYELEVSKIGTTSLKVAWKINGPRPGLTNFILQLSADDPADSMNYTVPGFDQRSYLAESLQEYWYYSVIVIASTSVGVAISDKTERFRTLPAAPGKVSGFDIEEAPDGNYTLMKITWKAPDELERNSIIESYTFEHYATGKITTTKNFSHQSSEDQVYTVILDVIPEKTYIFSVYAVNKDDQKGENITTQMEAPAGVPINIEKTLGIEIIPKGQVKNQGQNQFTISIVKEFFTEETYGVPQDTGLVACAKNCEFEGIETLADFNGLDNWLTASKNGYTLWKVTNRTWLTDLTKSSTNSRRKRSTTQLDYTVGSNDCSQVQPGEYCNGPLQPGTSYTIVAVSCTSGGCLVSKEYGPFVTLAVPDDENNLPMIIGIVVAVVVVVFIGAVVGFVLFRKKRSEPGKMKPASESDDDEFTTIDPAVAKIPRKRPIVLEEIEEYVNKMHKDSNLLFSAEYEDLKTLSPKHACEAADREENRMRNRYINIIPFDHTRVKLSTNGEDDSSDYINANYLPGYSSPREYIGCQGPIPGTIDDFWRMTWEQNVSVVVMLTLCKEGQKIKCEQYWPDEVGEPKQYGDVIVEITSYSNIRTYDYRMFKITNGSTTRVVKHFHFLSWLDFQANVHHDIILDFIQHVRQHVQPPDTSGPMIIHCSAGVGRTGTYIALDHLMQFINEHDFAVEIDIFDLVLKLRENRQHMVQTEQQYVFIHDCVKEIMDRKRRQMENIYENQAFLEKQNAAQDENIYQNEQSLYENVSQAKSEQNTEL